MPFATPLDVILHDKDKDLWALDKPLVYRDAYGAEFEVPAGFVCDFASVPRTPLLWWMFKRPDTHRAGVLHDWLCREGRVSRKYADQLFYEALRDDGVGYLRAKLMWAAVRLYAGIVANQR